jgi:hypothetical protein
MLVFPAAAKPNQDQDQDQEWMQITSLKSFTHRIK